MRGQTSLRRHVRDLDKGTGEQRGEDIEVTHSFYVLKIPDYCGSILEKGGFSLGEFGLEGFGQGGGSILEDIGVGDFFQRGIVLEPEDPKSVYPTRGCRNRFWVVCASCFFQLLKHI